MSNPGIFKQGNKAWEKRSKHGRDAIFSDANVLLQEFSNYCVWASKNPWYSYEWKSESKGANMGSELVKKRIPLLRAFTLIDFAHYMGVSASWLRNFKANLKTSGVHSKEVITDFLTVIEHIEESIYNQKFSAAAAGLLKENLIARDLGIADKNRNENINLNGDLSRDEVKKISKDLDDLV